MTNIYLTKTCGDYYWNDKLMTGDFWRIVINDGVRAESIMRFPGSRTKKRIVEDMRNNFGWGDDVNIWVAS
jgi:hypothetical protein